MGLGLDEAAEMWVEAAVEQAELKAAGVARVRSRFSVAETIERLEAALRAKGITVFALIDHSGEAAKVGLRMPETKLLVFGSPKAGTPVMLAAPTSALDLPLKILVREDAETGAVLVESNVAAYLATRHGVPGELVPVLAGVEGLVASVAG